MTPADITAVATLVAAVGALIVAIVTAYNARSARTAAEESKAAAEQSKAEIVATKEGVFELGKRVDGRLSELLAASIAAAKADGVTIGEQAERDRSVTS